MTGRVVGGFRLEEVIGSGGMGVVYGGTGPDGSRAAVKLIVDGGVTDPEFLRRFEREARIRIDHPNICRVLGAGSDADGTPFIAFELMEGESLQARISRGTLSPAEAVEVGRQACRGLAAVHVLGVVHRDMKPSNLFLCTDGTVKLFDFGIAFLRTAAERTRLTSLGAVMGTPSYLSPEQARGDADVDARTDVWSLGAVLYEALAARGPFERDTVLATVVAVLMEQPRPLCACAPHVPPGLAAVIERAFRKPREERWSTAEAFGLALCAADLSVVAAPAPEHAAPRPSIRTDAHEAATALAPEAEAPRPTLPEGEQRVVAVLLAEGVRDPGSIERSVRQRGGKFIPLMGSRALGLFGGDVWEGDEVARAAAAALLARPGAARMAVASGRASSTGGGIGGTVLNAAEAGCAAGLAGVAVDGGAARILAGGFSVRDRGGGLWELLADQPPIRPAPPEDGETRSATVGRQVELARMQAALETVLREGRALGVLVTGPPGIGKTRLRMEMERLMEGAATPVRTLVGRAEPLRGEMAFSLIASAVRGRARLGAALRGWNRLDAQAPPDERRRAVLDLVREAIGPGDAVPEWAEPLGELLGAPSPDVPPAGAAPRDPQVLLDRSRIALHDYFETLCRRNPLALLLEDLQWADAASVDFLGELATRLACRPLLILATARPEFGESRPGPFEGCDAIRIAPGGLAPNDVARLSESIVGHAVPAPLARAIAERTAGNPLFVREIVLALRERRLLDRWFEDLPLPLTVEAAVQSRLDHLQPAEKDLCKRAAVFGRPFTCGEVEALGAGGAGVLLASLGRKDLVSGRARSAGAGREFQFKSTLVADVAYRMLADDLRMDLHRRAAAHLAGIAGADHEEVGTHHERGGEPSPAAACYARAALGAAGRGDSGTVVRCAERAVRLGLPPEGRFDLYTCYADALGFLGRRDDQMPALAAAAGYASSDADRASVMLRQAELLWRTGRPVEATATAEAAVGAARRAGRADVLASVRGWQVASLAAAGRMDEAREALMEALELATDAPPHVRVFLATRRADLAAATGDLSERRDALRESIALCQEAGDVRRSAGAEANLADVLNRVGAYADAVDALRAALESCRRVGHRVREGYALANLGYSLAALGRTDEALASLDRAAELAGTTRDARLAVWIQVYRSRAMIGGPNPFEAVDEAERAVAGAERAGGADLRVVALSAAARAKLVAGDIDAALDLSSRALALRDEMGGIEEDEAEVYLAHAQALQEAGRRTEAEDVLARGRRRLLEVADRIADPGWRTRFLHGVPAHRALLAAAGGRPAGPRDAGPPDGG